MLVSQAHSFTQQARLAITLAWIAGCTNIVTILACGTVTSHATGTASNLAGHVVAMAWHDAAFALYLLVVFFFGAAFSGAMTETGRRRGWTSIYILPMLAQAVLLSIFAIGVELHEPSHRFTGPALWWLTGVASLAMGLQNATITRISSGVVRTTHLTGVLTDLGTETVQFLLWLRDRNRDSPPLNTRAMVHSIRVHPTARRLALLASIIGSFILGAAVGTLFFAHLARYCMVPPVAFLLWIIWQDSHTPICEIEPASLANNDPGFALPDGLAVYHLRKGADRKGRVHRLPDLLRWCERLPKSSRVVVLDLGDVTRLDSNAALELRALIHQSNSRGRQLIFAGMTGDQYRAVREAGAGDALDPTNVCPDLELAIARGLMLLDNVRPPRAAAVGAMTR